jgi:hypothetical protein
MPRLARSLWAASVGTVFLVMGASALMQSLTPAAMDWLSSHNAWALGITGGIWGVSLVYNLVDCRSKRKTDDEGVDDAEGGLATA